MSAEIDMPIATSGKNETSIISSVTLTPASGQPNYSTLTVNYTDEWAMDAYDVYVKVNNGSPTFFSEGIWTSSPGPPRCEMLSKLMISPL